MFAFSCEFLETKKYKKIYIIEFTFKIECFLFNFLHNKMFDKKISRFLFLS
jgi:hypothetical protein